MCCTGILYVFFANVFEIGSLGVTRQVVVELVKEHTGDQLRVLGQKQLVRKFRDLATHLEDLPQSWKSQKMFSSRDVFDEFIHIKAIKASFLG